MGSFETFVSVRERQKFSRTLFSGSIGPAGQNGDTDLRLVSRALSNMGLLIEDTSPSETRNAIFRAIQHAQRTTHKSSVIKRHRDHTLQPGDDVEHAVRRAFARGRFPISHRIIAETTETKEPKKVVYRGMRRAYDKLSSMPVKDVRSSVYRRARLPGVSAETFQTNRRLADAIINGGEIPGIDTLIARTISEHAKQGYADVQDFFKILRAMNAKIAERLAQKVYRQLNGHAKRRFRKLISSYPPTEADFR